ncbi:hypothetical protein A2890_00965 [candidate division WWE3 bacterium RIFCSPLOWO2_01_FULL_53_14]|uniref:Small ribosomal subunit protein bS20 n=1 Tax=candidate division WWE3 bacterium RIFCSPLOWO2_01_FULL_53_14 TaxID=1802628 RepID=A0A1F4VR76_UNCKA|nr:MAG: hypothetical protein A2890_00965 [candidate division WWE3 bacterium RIFCSPLOWO2_01_FULL_53_14]
MPHLKSAAKNLRKSRRKAALNAKIEETLKKTLKGPVTLKTLPIIMKVVDKAAKRKILSKNKAARLKSGLSKRIK